jgi:predicted TIM-barrel fold metal-dependent hydrolase
MRITFIAGALFGFTSTAHAADIKVFISGGFSAACEKLVPEFERATGHIQLKKKPTEYLKQLHFDALVFTGEALRHLVAQVGASQVMTGSDHPFPWEQHPVDHIMGSPLSDKDKVAILSENAAKLFGIKINGAG